MTTSQPVPASAGSDRCGCPSFRMSRRRLLGTSMAAGGTLAAGQLFGDAYRQVAYGAQRGGNVVVVLSLRGGSDGLSVVVPRGEDHTRLASYRRSIVVPESKLLGDDGRFGLHPALAPLLPMWNAGTMGAVHAVGQPRPNRSHFAAMEEIEDADLTSSTRIGWINRVTGLDATAAPQTAVSLGSTLLPTSLVGPAAALGADGVEDFAVADLGVEDLARRRAALRTMWGATRTPLGAGVRLAVDAAQEFEPLVAAADTKVHASAYPDGPLRDVLANTAALIREDLGTSTVTIDYGDWDMHEGLGGLGADDWMNRHLTHLAQSLAAFFKDLGGAASRVTLVTISEFGRRVRENGNGGVDHGYANAMLLLGAGVHGRAVHGLWPGLREEDLLDGDLAMRNDFRQVLWEVVSDRFPHLSGKRTTVFPGLEASGSIGVMG